MPSAGELNSTTAGDSTQASVEGRLLCLSTRFNCAKCDPVLSVLLGTGRI